MFSTKLPAALPAWPLAVQLLLALKVRSIDVRERPSLPEALGPRSLPVIEGLDWSDWQWPTYWPTSWGTSTKLITSTEVLFPTTSTSESENSPTSRAVGTGTGIGTGSAISPGSAVVTVTVSATTSDTSISSSGSHSKFNSSSASASSTTPSSAAMTTATSTDTSPTALLASPTNTNSSTSQTATSSSDSNTGVDGHRTLVITLSAVLGSVGLALIVGTVLLCARYRRRRFPFFPRGISPIDDDEIATWKISRSEKAVLDGVEDVPTSSGSQQPLVRPATAAEASAASFVSAAVTSPGSGAGTGPTGAAITKSPHAKKGSVSSVRKPPSVIVYNNPEGQGMRRSEETSPWNFSIQQQQGPGIFGRVSLEKELPQTPIQARAPNARAGLTDEAIPGDDPFISTPKRHPSRLSKLPPTSSGSHSSHSHSHSHHHTHARTRSSRSSLRSFAEYGWAGSEAELSPRASHEQMRSAQHHRGGGGGGGTHSRVYSSSSIPPRMSLENERVLAGLSPRPLVREEDIGRAIG